MMDVANMLTYQELSAPYSQGFESFFSWHDLRKK